jgi:DNA-binding transcriptional regulator of glucitol operon
MSLRAFHIIFVIVCVALAVFVGTWGIREYQREGSTGGLALGIIFIVSAVALVIYGVRVFRKLKEIP